MTESNFTELYLGDSDADGKFEGFDREKQFHSDV